MNYESQYLTALRAIGPKWPQVASVLMRAEANRAVRLKALDTAGRQLQAMDEILTYIGELERYFLGEPKVARLAFLLHRVGGDFGTAIEASLSAFHKTGLDSMRDVMEIEFLFRDFALEPKHIDEWLTAPEKVRHDKFRPAVLRQRYASYEGKSTSDMSEATDYKGHSQLLYVLPFENPIVWAAPGDALDSVGTLVCFYDIFEHARRLFAAVGSLACRLELSCPSAEGFLKITPSVWAESQDLWDRVMPMLAGSRAL